jgi:hypothetical protein
MVQIIASLYWVALSDFYAALVSSVRMISGEFLLCIADEFINILGIGTCGFIGVDRIIFTRFLFAVTPRLLERPEELEAMLHIVHPKAKGPAGNLTTLLDAFVSEEILSTEQRLSDMQPLEERFAPFCEILQGHSDT